MGLDNGLMIRGKNHKNLNLPHKTNDYWSEDTEICYWRKFWGGGLETMLLSVLNNQNLVQTYH